MLDILLDNPRFVPNRLNLIVLIKLNNTKLVSRLIEYPNLNIETLGRSIISKAIDKGNPEIIKLLFSDDREDIADIILLIGNNKSLDFTDYFLANPNIDRFIILLYAIQINKLNVVNQLINEGIDPSEIDNVALKYAIQYGNINIINRLLSDPRIKIDDDIIDLMLNDKKIDFSSILITNPNVPKKSLLIYAVKMKNSDVIDELTKNCF